MQIFIYIYRQNNYFHRKILFLVLLCLLNPFSHKNLFAQYKNLKFEHFKIEDSVLPIVPCLCQDRTGYIWAGTYWGIIRYDGYLFKPYLANYVFHTRSIHYKDTANVSNALVEAICDDDDGNIWAGNTMGLDKLDPLTEKFKHYILNPSMPLSDWSNHVLALCNDNKGNLWIGTGNGLYLFDRKTQKIRRFIHDNTDAHNIIHNSVNAIYKDRSGNMWFGTGAGLEMLDSSGSKFIHFWKYPDSSSSWGSIHWILSIFEDKDGIIWFGTQNGLVEFNKAAVSFTVYKNNPKDPQSLSNNSINSICQDENGFIWLSTGVGLDIFDKRIKKFFHYRSDKSDPASLSTNEIAQILIDRSGTIWIGSYGGGLNKCIPPSSFLKEYPFENIGDIPRHSGNLIEDLNGKIWIGTDKGLISFDPVKEELKKENFKRDVAALNIDEAGTIWVSSGPGNLYYKKNKELVFKKFPKEKIFNEDIISMRNSIEGNIWLGTSNGRILKLNPHSKEVEKKLKYDYGIPQIYEDKNDCLWLGTSEAGVIRYNQKTKSSTSFTSNPGDSLTLSGNNVYDFCEDSAGNFWIIINSIINKFDKGLQKFVRMFGRDGFNGDGFSMARDDHGNLWLSTGYGIDKYDPIKKQHIFYSDLKLGWIYITRKGEMYIITAPFFKEKQKLLRINIDYLQNNSFVPPIVITSFKKFEKPSPFGKEIYLNYDENFISFEFAALSFIKPEVNQYAYKMEGIDKDWIYSDTRRYASYPNLTPGKYIFKVKGSNNDEVWNETGTSIAIIISPPWWKTWWAYSSYALIFVFSLFGIRRYELNRLKLKDKVKMDEAVLAEREETDKMKSRFFANISHEFRTPLTLILGPAEKIVSETSEDVVKDANIIKRNSRRLLQLINQLLDLSKIEAGKLKLETSKGNIVSFVKGIALSFESLSEEKDITLKITSEKDLIDLYFDKEKMLKILTNILSNAFKFTPQDGKITVSIIETHAEPIDRGSVDQAWKSKMKEFVEIKIRDTGIGIHKEEIPKLFDRFYQVDSSFTKEYEGTGIGLALTKELVELHYGSIKVESEIGEYTEFTLHFPLGREHLKDDEIVTEEKTEKLTMFFDQERYPSEKNLTEESIEEINAATLNEDKTIILIVEDNYDMRAYIKESLDENYVIEEAVNGEQGIRKALKIIPDLIISDMMMPKMDGNEMTKFLKNDEKTSHIPIIILTARSGQENKLEGLQTGADDYLTKPFDIKELQIRIENLISIRKKLQQKFSGIESKPLKITEKKLSSIDEKFMIKVKEIIEKHISEEEFKMDEFSEELGMSRMQVHRKLKALTGKSATLYIRYVKLLKAKKMLENREGTISEIAYSLGFGSPTYFTKCFKEEFHLLPSDI
jgi:signal transduction histidine kinase/ligand-binding sensor domain-containing protein/DNA-binding response OmpR family regulator